MPGNLPEDGLCSSSPIRGQRWWEIANVFGTCHVNVVEGYPRTGVHGLPVPLGAIILVRGVPGRLDSMLDVGKVQSRWSPFLPIQGTVPCLSSQLFPPRSLFAQKSRDVRSSKCEMGELAAFDHEGC